jgi:hypothetical protein
MMSSQNREIVLPNKYDVKDTILKHLIDPKYKDLTIVSQISKHLGYDYNLISYLSDELINEGFLLFKDVASRELNMPFDKALIITNSAKYFLEFEGGFEKRKKQDEEQRLKEEHRYRLLEDFHKTSADRNRLQKGYFMLSIIISFIALATSILVAIFK